ncbi:chemotaxis protein [Acidovorax sp. GW101-3H11]|uniref:methyl-accepting chemotaxis protein n=1 Tax=unclassified Acidovorax TaxID=2684926 RepID=UPI0007B52F90|nr:MULTISPECIES: methyl-accepting chemotaxis protein [unclassified Acidovorax]KZT15977.1 chemotaxis protein [Acidovorax sp. GW101-3H11]MBW8462134.1 cache domain-containing protein [Acidovorax sp.]
MSGFLPLRPGLWWMRRWHLPGKLVTLGVLMAVVLVATAAAPGWGGAVGAVALLYGLLALYLSLSSDLEGLSRAMQKTTQGDLSTRAGVYGQDEVGAMAQSLDQMVLTLSSMVADIRSNAALVAHAGQSLAQGNRSLADRTEQQAANLEQTAASVEQLSSAVQNNAQTARSADARAADVRKAADAGAEAMARAVQSVEAIQQGARRMTEIIGVIDSIAFQTNILALNAAVEAARAGEQGRGFAVVAGEVRTLAKRSGDAAREIRELIGASVSQVEASAGLIRSAGDGIANMAGGIRSVAASMTEISGSSAEQSTGLSEVSSAVQQLDQITQHNAQMVGHAVAQAEALEQRATTLSRAVAAFRLQQGTADEAVALVQKAVALYKTTSHDQFLRSLTDKNQPYHDRDMYVFVLDSAGTYRAFGGNPAKVGTRVQDIPGIAGDRLVSDIVAQADRAPGWVEYDINNPATGAVQTKMSYVSRVGDLYVGCGVYKSLAAR